MLATAGQTLADAHRREDELRLENALLENEIAKRKSLQWVSIEATKSGFVPATRVEFIK